MAQKRSSDAWAGTKMQSPIGQNFGAKSVRLSLLYQVCIQQIPKNVPQPCPHDANRNSQGVGKHFFTAPLPNP